MSALAAELPRVATEPAPPRGSDEWKAWMIEHEHLINALEATYPMAVQCAHEHPSRYGDVALSEAADLVRTLHLCE